MVRSSPLEGSLPPLSAHWLVKASLALRFGLGSLDRVGLADPSLQTLVCPCLFALPLRSPFSPRTGWSGFGPVSRLALLLALPLPPSCLPSPPPGRPCCSLSSVSPDPLSRLALGGLGLPALLFGGLLAALPLRFRRFPLLPRRST